MRELLLAAALSAAYYVLEYARSVRLDGLCPDLIIVDGPCTYDCVPAGNSSWQ